MITQCKCDAAGSIFFQLNKLKTPLLMYKILIHDCIRVYRDEGAVNKSSAV